MKYVLALVLICGSLAGCTGGGEPPTDSKLEPAEGRVAEPAPTEGGEGMSDATQGRQQGGGNKEAGGGK